MTTTLIVPGLNSSGSAHWQTWFESQLPNAVRVIQADWKRANLPDWSSRIRREISRNTGPILIAAHSFGALAAVQAAEDLSDRIVGVLLVAPADPDKFGVTDVLPVRPLAFPATIVASRNDPWLPFEGAAALAARWGADLVDLGSAGHINAEAGYGPWPFGLRLLKKLASGERNLRDSASGDVRRVLPRSGQSNDLVTVQHAAQRGRSGNRLRPDFETGLL